MVSILLLSQEKPNEEHHLLAGCALLILLAFYAVSFETRPASAQDAIPTVDASASEPDPTVIELEHEKLRLEVRALRDREAHPIRIWLESNATVLVGIIAAGWAVLSWLSEQRTTSRHHAEERFETLSNRLDSDQSATRLSAAINLRLFLQPGYEPFYGQVFSLAVAHLRLRQDPAPWQAGGTMSEQATPLNQALAFAFAESYPLARDHAWDRKKRVSPTFLPGIPWFESRQDLARRRELVPEASGLGLSAVNLNGIELRGIWMPRSSIISVGLLGADLRDANLQGSSLIRCNFSGARINGAKLTSCVIGNSTFERADLRNVDFSFARLNTCNLSGALLNGANPEDSQSLTSVRMFGVSGLTDEQRQECEAKGAMFEKTA